MKQVSTHLGKFLLDLRLARGHQNIKAYVQEYALPISSTYYRDLELGKKQVSTETAKTLCDALQADESRFYHCLLQDVIPARALSMLTASSITEQDNIDKSAILTDQIFDKQKLLAEAQKSFELPVHPDGLHEGCTLSLYSVGGIDRQNLRSVHERITQLWQELDDTDEADGKNEDPFFCMVVLSARPEYSPS